MMHHLKRTLLSLLIHQLLLPASNTPTGPQNCDVDKPCALGTVSRDVCRKRHCCYAVKNYTLTNCFRDSEVRVTKRPKPQNEVLPHDSINLPKNLEQSLKNLRNLSKTEALKVIDQFEKYIKNEAKKDSQIDWDYEVADTFRVVVKIEPDSLFEPATFTSGTEVKLQQNWGTMADGSPRNISHVIYIEYPSLIQVFIQDQEERLKHCPPSEMYMEGSPVISVNVFDENWDELSAPVTYTVEGLNTTKPKFNNSTEANLSCTFLQEILKKWSSRGCEVAQLDGNLMSCSCNHTTKFSMLFVLREMELNISDHHWKNINTLEYIMESLSFTCLVATFGVLTIVQRRRSKGSSLSGMRAGERTAVHANFVSSLALLHFTRLFSELAMSDDKACKAIAVLSHYFILASGMWMLIEGLLLYINVIIRSMKNTALGVHKYWVGWGIPATIVVISAAIGLTKDIYTVKIHTEECREDNGIEIVPVYPDYKKYQSFCWLGHSEKFIWSAAGPLILIFAINIFILAHTVLFIWRLNRKTDKMMPSDCNNERKHFWKTAKSVFVLFPILGVPWLIGFLINTGNTTWNLIFQYTHVILNGLQGFFIFLLYCVVNRESRGIVSRVASSRWEQHKVSVSASNTLARSTSGGSRRRGQRKSISSQMGASEQYPTPANITRMGSLYSIYTSSMNRKQSSGSGSTSISGCAQRINRINSLGVGEMAGTRYKPSHYMKAGSSASLPRLGKIESHKYVVHRRSGSVSSINMIESSVFPKKELSDVYICKICKDTPCVHAASSVAGLQERDAKEAVLLGYKRTSSLDSLPMPEMYTQNRFPRRMTAEEFKRFSAIPEEKRRSGINSFISPGESSEHLANRKSTLAALKTNDIEMKEMQKTAIKANLKRESSRKDSENRYHLEEEIAKRTITEEGTGH